MHDTSAKSRFSLWWIHFRGRYRNRILVVGFDVYCTRCLMTILQQVKCTKSNLFRILACFHRIYLFHIRIFFHLVSVTTGRFVALIGSRSNIVLLVRITSLFSFVMHAKQSELVLVLYSIFSIPNIDARLTSWATQATATGKCCRNDHVRYIRAGQNSRSPEAT